MKKKEKKLIILNIIKKVIPQQFKNKKLWYNNLIDEIDIED